MSKTESKYIIHEYENTEALYRYFNQRMINDMLGVNPLDPKENLKREIRANIDCEVRYINILGIYYILIRRNSSDILDNYTEPWVCISYSFLDYRDRAACIEILKYAREKYQITRFIPKDRKEDIAIFEEAGYFNFGDPCDHGKILRSKDDINLSRLDKKTIYSLMKKSHSKLMTRLLQNDFENFIAMKRN